MKKNILICEDDIDCGALLKSLLERADYKTDLVRNGRDCVNLYSEKYDLLLLDLQIPILDGLEVLSRIKKSHPEAIVIIMTAYSSIEQAADGASGGPDGTGTGKAAEGSGGQRADRLTTSGPGDGGLHCMHDFPRLDGATANGCQDFKPARLPLSALRGAHLLAFAPRPPPPPAERGALTKRGPIATAVGHREAARCVGIAPAFLPAVHGPPPWEFPTFRAAGSGPVRLPAPRGISFCRGRRPPRGGSVATEAATDPPQRVTDAAVGRGRPERRSSVPALTAMAETGGTAMAQNAVEEAQGAYPLLPPSARTDYQQQQQRASAFPRRA